MQLIYKIGELFTAFQPFLEYFYPFIAVSVFYLTAKIIKECIGGAKRD